MKPSYMISVVVSCNFDTHTSDGPATVEDIQQACLVDPMGFTI